MKDLKHLEYFENLLQESNNDLVREAKEEGRKAIGYTCYQIPEPVLNLPGCFSLRLSAPRVGGIEMGTYYMTSMTCEYCRALVGRDLEGGYQFLDGLIGAASCSQLADAHENMEKHGITEREGFFIEHVDTPMKSDENAVNLIKTICEKRILKPLRENYGIDTGDAALRRAVEEHNEVCKLLNAIGEYRKLDNPPITGYEFAVLTLATYTCPKDKLVKKLKETLKELKTREPDVDYKKKYRARVLVAGSEMDDPEYIKCIEEAGALVVCDRYCFGQNPGRNEIILTEDEDALTQVCRQNVMENQCPRYMGQKKIQSRKDYVDKLAKEYKADGLIYQQMKFCNFWGYERAACSHIMRDDYGWPVLSIDRPYVNANSGQLRTRVQAFVESIEIKKIQRTQDASRAQGADKLHRTREVSKMQGGGR